MATDNIRRADSKGRIALPDFANATVLVERIDESEYRIRRARVIAENEFPFHETQFPVKLSAEEAVAFLDMLDNPPAPNRAAKKAAKEFLKNRERAVDRRKAR